jgi:TPP-dependent 2-oxoacid decarboxylase
MSIQEVGTMIKKGVTPYLFVINNDGWVPREPVGDGTDAA